MHAGITFPGEVDLQVKEGVGGRESWDQKASQKCDSQEDGPMPPLDTQALGCGVNVLPEAQMGKTTQASIQVLACGAVGGD